MLDILEKTQVESEEIKSDLMFNFRKEYKEQDNIQTEHLSNYNEDDVKKQVQVVILQSKLEIGNTNILDCEVCGKSMLDWIKNSVSDYQVIVVEYNQQDIVSFIKDLQIDKKYVLVLFANTPLIRKNTVEDIVEYFVIKQLSVLKLIRGYMFSTEYLSRIERLLNPQEQPFNEEDFIAVSDVFKFGLVNEIMQKRIISYHQKNGVIFESAGTSKIDADVSIDAGVIIGINTRILGNSIIEGGVKLSDVAINNSVIKANSILNNCIVNQSVVGNNCVIQDYCVVKDKSIIGDNSRLNGMNMIVGKILPSQSNVELGEKRS